MKILVLTGYCGERFYRAGALSANNKNEYAAKHGYDFFCLRSTYCDYKDPVSWLKIEWIQKNLKNYDWIFWSDADSVITNQEIKLEDIINNKFTRPTKINVSPGPEPISIDLPRLKESNYIVAYDDYSPCMGNFLIKGKGADRSGLFLELILNLKSKYYNDPIWDNRAQDYLFSINDCHILEYVDFVPQKALNSGIHQWTKGDFVLHFYATSEKWRLEKLIETAIKTPLSIFNVFNECELQLGRQKIF